MRILAIIFLFMSSTAWSQSLIDPEPDQFPQKRMKDNQVESVDVYVITHKLSEIKDKEGNVMRVVRAPRQSFFFNRAGELIEERVLNTDTRQMVSQLFFTYGPHGIQTKRKNNYVTRQTESLEMGEDPTKGMQVAYQSLSRYAYDTQGNLLTELVYMVDAEGGEALRDSSRFSYGGNNALSHSHKTLTWMGEETQLSYRSLGGGKYRAELAGEPFREYQFDDQKRLTRSKRFFQSEEGNSSFEQRYFYKGERLDSVWVGTAQGGQEATAGTSTRYYYDKGGKLVMTREMPWGDLPPGGGDVFGKDEYVETLYDYFYFDENE